MTFTISEIEFEANRQDIASEYLDIKLNCQCLFYYLEVFDMSTIGNSVHKKLVLQFHAYILQQRKVSLYANNVSQRSVCKMNKSVA
jgi:hypothetical protein